MEVEFFGDGTLKTRAILKFGRGLFCRWFFDLSAQTKDAELLRHSHCNAFLSVQTYGSRQTSAPSLLMTDHPLK
jgi:hypothetical protein